MTIADLTEFSEIYHFKYLVEPDMSKLKNIGRWMDEMMTVPEVKESFDFERMDMMKSFTKAKL